LVFFPRFLGEWEKKEKKKKKRGRRPARRLPPSGKKRTGGRWGWGGREARKKKEKGDGRASYIIYRRKPGEEGKREKGTGQIAPSLSFLRGHRKRGDKRKKREEEVEPYRPLLSEGVK